MTPVVPLPRQYSWPQSLSSTCQRPNIPICNPYTEWVEKSGPPRNIHEFDIVLAGISRQLHWKWMVFG